MIHKYELNGYKIVIDPCSGAVHLFDDTAYDIVSLIKAAPMSPDCPEDIVNSLSEKYSTDSIKEAYSDIYALYREGTLFSEDDYAEFAEMLGSAPVKSMCLNVAHDCNLKCEYCFAAQGDFGMEKGLMPFEVAKSAIDFLIKHSGGRRNLELDFFGGEPLMNFDVVKKTVEYARSVEKEHGKNFRFTLTTNGLLLNDEIIDYLNREMYNLVLSLDGRKEVNDKLRPTRSGSGSYDIIVPKYQKLIEKRGDGQYYVRGTFTRHNLDFADDLLHLADDLGFDQLSVEPVVTADENDYALRESDLPRIFEEYERLANIILERKLKGNCFNFFHFMIDLEQGPCAIKRLRGCSCGNEYIAVTPNGDIYPCHQFVGMDEWKMGNVLDGSLDYEKKKYFSKTHIYYKDECKNCWARFYCSGGCNANNYASRGSVLKPHRLSCELEKKRLECAIMIKVALAAAE
ncbi:MAG: thioether cross-link-forming SCIFF peptide maturase [Clostridiales bacterium]|nr:thioether cross-link-forming SCIFF peptide maturase [Clostridiales bacterium]HQD72399.1 thioether cross-link-forming SCIFF peptide maturase [Clostridiales bacterium]